VIADVRLASGGHTLDARLHAPDGEARGAAVVAHPHPAHGGHMDHPVVVIAAERAARAGLWALRFDFRGVRRSEGDAGDHDGHLEDVCRACALVSERAPGLRLFGAGFSYGARQLARAVSLPAEERPPVAGLLLLAPAVKVPRTNRDFGNLLLGRPLRDAPLDAPAMDALGRIPVRTRVLVGDHDVVAPVDDLAEALAPTAALTVLSGLSHFFSRDPGAGPTATDVLVPAVDAAWRALLGT